ncbi:hypothetical protein LCGC14_0857220 [marine sediment metagenome]|uniref:Uncharacterized protein n=1 Tax=marine sediment metagenome TaxID=412755 RepID=A0A0F9RT35_9ZZZZ
MQSTLERVLAGSDESQRDVVAALINYVEEEIGKVVRRVHTTEIRLKVTSPAAATLLIKLADSQDETEWNGLQAEAGRLIYG